MKFIASFILVFAVAIWQSVFTGPKLLPVPPKQLKHKGFTILPFNEKGWMLIQSKPYRLVLARRGEATDESYAIIVAIFSLPEFKWDRKFLRYIKTGLKKESKNTRFRKLKISARLYEAKQTMCVRHHTKVEDKAAKRQSKKTGPMILEIIGFTCRHPKDAKAGIQVSISKRYYPGNPDPGLKERAQELLKRTTFVDF